MKIQETTYQDKLLLWNLLKAIVENDTNYDLRNRFIYEAMSVAAVCGYPHGFRIDASEPEWPVAFIWLPTGQVSWHLPQFPEAWDGHSTEEKFKRIADFKTRMFE